MRVNRNRPIGVFDSGLGGLTVVKELMRILPNEDIVYFGDTARVPYGTKSRESIIRFSRQNVAILKKYNVKMVVVACNSSSSYALNILKKAHSMPIVGVIAPGVKRAVEITKNKRIGVIATSATVKSNAYVKKIIKYDDSIKVVSQACPLFVPLVEEGWIRKKETLSITSEYLKKIKQAKPDTLILGCTHYPLLKFELKKVMGAKVSLVDSAYEVANEVKDILNKKNLFKLKKTKGVCKFLSSDAPDHFLKSAKNFLGCNIKSVKKHVH